MTDAKLSLLHLHQLLGESSCANQFVLPSPHEVAIVSFFESTLSIPERIPLFEGDGTIRGFMRALRRALAARSYDVVHAHGPLNGFLLLLHCLIHRRRPARLVFTAHHSFTNRNLKLYNRLLLLPIFAFYDRITCVGEASLRSFPRPYRALAGSRLSAVRNGVDLERIDRVLAGTQVARPRRFTIASVGRQIPIKNPFAVLDAFEAGAAASARLLFVGGGGLEEGLARRSAEGPAAGRVELSGALPREMVYRVLAGTDLFISASRGDGMPMAVLEAMACRVPVVLSDIPPHKEIVRGADFIPLVAPDNVAGFAAQIARYQAMPAGERARIGARCRELIEKRFRLSAMQEGYDALYFSLLNRGQPIGAVKRERTYARA